MLLTPNHFLHGQLGGQFAPETVDTTEFSPRKRWRKVQEIISQVWRRWLEEVAAGVSSAAEPKAEMDASGERSEGCRACFGFKTAQRTMASRTHH